MLAIALLACAQERLIYHPNGVFEDTTDGTCFRYAAIGAQGYVLRVDCPRYSR